MELATIKYVIDIAGIRAEALLFLFLPLAFSIQAVFFLLLFPNAMNIMRSR